MAQENAFAWLSGSVLCTVLLVGCGTSVATYPVTGEIVFPDGAPLPGGTVEFRSIEKSPSTAPRIATSAIGADGTFRLSTRDVGDGAAPGEYQVAISPLLPDDLSGIPPAQQRRAMEPIERKYWDFATSELRYTVTEDESRNHFRIQVKRPR